MNHTALIKYTAQPNATDEEDVITDIDVPTSIPWYGGIFNVGVSAAPNSKYLLSLEKKKNLTSDVTINHTDWYLGADGVEASGDIRDVGGKWNFREKFFDWELAGDGTGTAVVHNVEKNSFTMNSSKKSYHQVHFHDQTVTRRYDVSVSGLVKDKKSKLESVVPKKAGDKSIIQDEFYKLEKIFEKYEYGSYFKNLKVNTFKFNKDFSKLKNYTKEHCSGDYIFHIDADEIPNETLLKQLPEILEINDTDLVWVPRINIVNGITDWHLHHWHWRQTEQGWINFPDYQARIFRNTDDIKWIKPVHEVIDGAKTYSHLPPQEELTLKHEKEINKQEQQNRLYDSII